MSVSVDEFQIADPASAWWDAGFSVDPDGVCRIGDVRVRLLGSEGDAGILGWTLRGLAADGAADHEIRHTNPPSPATHPMA